MILPNGEMQTLRRGMIKAIAAREFRGQRARVCAQGMKRDSVAEEESHLRAVSTLAPL